jgi:hypothetical protein
METLAPSSLLPAFRRTARAHGTTFFLVAVERPEASNNEMSDEQEDIGHSMTINNELRLCEMTEDEDDVLLILIF